MLYLQNGFSEQSFAGLKQMGYKIEPTGGVEIKGKVRPNCLLQILHISYCIPYTVYIVPVKSIHS